MSTSSFHPPEAKIQTHTPSPTFTSDRSLRSISIENFFKNGSVKQLDNYLTQTASKASLLSEEVRVIVGKHSSAVLHSSNHIHDMLENSKVILSNSQTAKGYLSEICRILDKQRHSQLQLELAPKPPDDVQRELWINLLMSIDKLDIFSSLQHISMVLLEMEFIKAIPLHTSTIPIQFLKFFITQKCIHFPSEITSLVYNTRKPLQCIQLIYQELPILFGLMDILFNNEEPLEILLKDMQTKLNLFNLTMNKEIGHKATLDGQFEIQATKKEYSGTLDLYSLLEESLSQISDCPQQIHSFCMHNMGDNNLSSTHLVDFVSVLLLLDTSNTQLFNLVDFFVLRGATLSALFDSFVNFMEIWPVDPPVSEYESDSNYLEYEPLIKHLSQFIYAFEATLFCILFLFSEQNSVPLIENYYKSIFKSLNSTLTTWEVHVGGKQMKKRLYTPKLKLKPINEVKNYLTRIQQGELWEQLSQIIFEFINNWTNKFLGQFNKFLTNSYTKFSCKSLVLFWNELKKKISLIREGNMAMNLIGMPNPEYTQYKTPWKYICRQICGTEFDDPLDLLEKTIYTVCADIIHYTSKKFQFDQVLTAMHRPMNPITTPIALFDKTKLNFSELRLIAGNNIAKLIEDSYQKMDIYFKLVVSELEFLYSTANSLSLEFIDSQLILLLEVFINYLNQLASSKIASQSFEENNLTKSIHLEEIQIGPEILQPFINALKFEGFLNDFEHLNFSGKNTFPPEKNLSHFQKFCKFCLSQPKEEISKKLCEFISAMEEQVLFIFSKFIVVYNTPLLSRISRELDNKISETSLESQISGLNFPEQATPLLFQLLLNCSQLFSRLYTDLMLKNIPLRLIFAAKQGISHHLSLIYKEKLNHLRERKRNLNLLLFQLLFDVSLANMLMSSSHYSIEKKLSEIFHKHEPLKEEGTTNNILEQLEQEILENFLTDPADKLLAHEMIRNKVSQVMVFSSTLFSFLIKENPKYVYWLQYEPSESVFTKTSKPIYSKDFPMLPIPTKIGLISVKNNKKNAQQPFSLPQDQLPDKKTEFPTKKVFTTSSPIIKSSPTPSYFRAKVESSSININTVYDISKQMENVSAYIGKRVGSMQNRMTEVVKKKSDRPNIS